MASGASALNTGADTLASGAGELASGNQTLAEGMSEFKTSGIDKIAEVFGGDITKSYLKNRRDDNAWKKLQIFCRNQR